MPEQKFLIQQETGRKYAYCPLLARRADMVVHTESATKKPAPKSQEAKIVEADQIDDAFIISTAMKDELEAFARAEFDVELDKRRSVESLRDQVRGLAEA